MQERHTRTATGFERHLKSFSAEELQELGPAMDELESCPGWRVVRDLLDKERQTQMQALVAEAGHKTEQEYARALGELKGLQALDACLQTVKDKAERADQELRQRLAGAAAEVSR